MAAGVNKNIETVLKSLKVNCFDPVEFVEETDTATKLVLDMIPLKATVGVPGSVTVRQIGLVTQLKARGTKVIDIAIVFVGKDLGLGWDPSWLSERKEKIASAYRETRRDFPKAIQPVPIT